MPTPFGEGPIEVGPSLRGRWEQHFVINHFAPNQHIWMLLEVYRRHQEMKAEVSFRGGLRGGTPRKKPARVQQLVIIRISGQVVEYIVAIDVTRV